MLDDTLELSLLLEEGSSVLLRELLAVSDDEKDSVALEVPLSDELTEGVAEGDCVSE